MVMVMAVVRILFGHIWSICFTARVQVRGHFQRCGVPLPIPPWCQDPSEAEHYGVSRSDCGFGGFQRLWQEYHCAADREVLRHRGGSGGELTPSFLLSSCCLSAIVYRCVLHAQQFTPAFLHAQQFTALLYMLNSLQLCSTCSAVYSSALHAQQFTAVFFMLSSLQLCSTCSTVYSSALHAQQFTALLYMLNSLQLCSTCSTVYSSALHAQQFTALLYMLSSLQLCSSCSTVYSCVLHAQQFTPVFYMFNTGACIRVCVCVVYLYCYCLLGDKDRLQYLRFTLLKCMLMWFLSWVVLYNVVSLTHLAPDQLPPFRYEIPCEGK